MALANQILYLNVKYITGFHSLIIWKLTHVFIQRDQDQIDQGSQNLHRLGYLYFRAPNLCLPALAPNLCLPALAPNLYLTPLASNLWLPALAPNLCLAALAPNLHLLFLASYLLFTSSGQDFTTTTAATCTVTTTTITTTTTTTGTNTTRDNNNKRCLRGSKTHIKWPLKDIRQKCQVLFQ